MKGESSFGENKGGTEARLWNVFGGLDDGGQSAGNVAYVFDPFNSNSYTFCLWSSSSKPGGNYRMYKGIGNLYQLSSITGIQAELNESAGEFASGGKIRVYGLRVDS